MYDSYEKSEDDPDVRWLIPQLARWGAGISSKLHDIKKEGNRYKCSHGQRATSPYHSTRMSIP